VQNIWAGTNGGGIYTRSVGGVILTSNSAVSNNTSGLSGAGIYCDNSNVSVISSTVSGNKSSSHAGGIYNYSSTLYLNQATLSGNTAVRNGGGIYNYQGVVIMEGGKLTGAHTAVHGGGIFNNDGEEVSLHSATIEGATASGDGGGIYTQGFNDVSLFQSTVQTNTATGNGGGIYATSRLGVSFDASTISNNTAGLKGGGIYSFGRCLGKHSTVSTNTATGAGGGIYSYKDGTDNNAYLELSWTTVGYNRGAQSGGVVVEGHANTFTRSSIVARNQLANGTAADYYGNPHGQDGDNAFYKSVFGVCTNTDCRGYDIVGLSNILQLANNGGPTKTHEIPSNSSALNKFVAGEGWSCPATDQRGMPRPVGGACDLGSFERQ
jgi:predicted outer membrane repeat protein